MRRSSIIIAAILGAAQLLFIVAIIGPNWAWHVHNVMQGPSPIGGLVYELVVGVAILSTVAFQIALFVRSRRVSNDVLTGGLIVLVLLAYIDMI